MRRLVMGATAVSALALVSGHAFASGFQLKEQSSSAQGRATAGSTASAEDLSTIFFNPAGMTRFQGNAFESDVNYIAPSAKFKDSGSTSYTGAATSGNNGGDAGSPAAVPSLYGMYSVSDDFKLGLAVNAPYGLKTDYDAAWKGRYHALKSELATLNIQPSVAYRMSDWLSVGGGINIQHARAELTNAVDHGRIKQLVGLGGGGTGSADGITKLSGDGWGFGYTMGATVQFTEDTRLGISYKSRIEHTLEGDVTQSNVPNYGAVSAALARAFSNTGASAKLTTPDVLALGLHHDINPQWAVMGDMAYTNWSLFNELRVKRADGLADSVTPENWTDTWFFSLGTSYKPTKDLTLNMGVAFDQAPVNDADRTARIPDSDRTWLSGGIGYQLTDAVKLNAAYTHIWVANAKMDKATGALATGLSNATDTLRGTYESSINIFTLGLTATF